MAGDGLVLLLVQLLDLDGDLELLLRLFPPGGRRLLLPLDLVLRYRYLTLSIGLGVLVLTAASMKLARNGKPNGKAMTQAMETYINENRHLLKQEKTAKAATA